MTTKATQFRPLSFMPTASVILNCVYERQTKNNNYLSGFCLTYVDIIIPTYSYFSLHLILTLVIRAWLDSTDKVLTSLLSDTCTGVGGN